MTIQADLEHAHASLTQILDGLASSLVALHDATGVGYPSKASGAQSTPGTTVGRFVDDDSTAGVVLTLPERIMDDALQHRPDKAGVDRDELAAAAAQLRRASTRALDVVARYQRVVPTRQRMSEAEVPKDWCRSCYRDHQHHSPITLRPGSGVPFYTDLCRWCGDFNRAHKRLPSIEILQVRHQGKKVTMQMIDAQRPAKPTRKKGKR